VGGGRAGEAEMIVPSQTAVCQVRTHISAVIRQSPAPLVSIIRSIGTGKAVHNGDRGTGREWIGISYFAIKSKNIRPSQSSAMEVMSSGVAESFAQRKAAVTALPSNDTARDVLLVARGQPIGQKRDINVGLADERRLHGCRSIQIRRLHLFRRFVTSVHPNCASGKWSASSSSHSSSER
jgi:hypothetical protein